MAWVETAASPSSPATSRHRPTRPRRVLDDLEAFRTELEGAVRRRARRGRGGHPPAAADARAAPRPGCRWRAWCRRPAGRRYFAGLVRRGEIHVLAPAALEQRASGRAGLARGAAAEPRATSTPTWWSAPTTPSLPPPFTPGHLPPLRAHRPGCARAPPPTSPARCRTCAPAVARRLREGGRPAVPAGVARDALVLGGTVFGLLERERGPEACVELAAAPRHAQPAQRRSRTLSAGPARASSASWTDYLAALHRGLRAGLALEHLQQRRHHALVELRPGAREQLRPGLGVGHRRPVGPVAGHGVSRRRRPG